MSKYLNPLHTPEWIASSIRTRGRFDLERCTGRTTAKAMRLIAEAIENPYTYVTLSDHPVENANPYNREVNISNRVQGIINALELKQMYIVKIGGRYKLSFGKVV